MTEPPAPLALARALAVPLAGLRWAIGGSTLLHRLGLEPAPADLDLVITPDEFDRAAAVLAARFGAPQRPAHPHWRTVHFARFAVGEGGTATSIDLMAGIAVVRAGQVVHWPFDPATIAHADGLPWMRAEDWLALYALFDRPARVRQLEGWLAAAPAGAARR